MAINVCCYRQWILCLQKLVTGAFRLAAVWLGVIWCQCPAFVLRSMFGSWHPNRHFPSNARKSVWFWLTHGNFDVHLCKKITRVWNKSVIWMVLRFTYGGYFFRSWRFFWPAAPCFPVPIIGIGPESPSSNRWLFDSLDNKKYFLLINVSL